MATGRVVGGFEKALALVGVVAITISYFMITGKNPLPAISSWFSSFGDLSHPAPAWSQRYSSDPSLARVLPDAVIVVRPETVEARDPGDGHQMWKQAANWATVTGEGQSALVLVGQRGGGVQALSPATGQVRWKNPDLLGVWTFRTGLIALSCPKSGSCSLSQLSMSDGAQKWKTTVPGLNRSAKGINQAILSLKSPNSDYSSAVAIPGALTGAFGITVDDHAELLDPNTGTRQARQQLPSGARSALVAGTLVVASSKRVNGTCESTVEGRDPARGTVLWRRDGDPHTGLDLGCAAHHAPTGFGTTLVVTRQDGLESLVAGQNGREIWVGTPKETVGALGERYALIRSADGKQVTAIDLTIGAAAWKAPLPEHAALAVCQNATLVVDQDLGQLIARQPGNGNQLLKVRINGEVLGCGDNALVLARGRKLGYLKW